MNYFLLQILTILLEKGCNTLKQKIKKPYFLQIFVGNRAFCFIFILLVRRT